MDRWMDGKGTDFNFIDLSQTMYFSPFALLAKRSVVGTTVSWSTVTCFGMSLRLKLSAEVFKLFLILS